jgi:hypothetical protein
MKGFMESQDYIDSFEILDPTTEITHNLDRFRPAFVGHPGNYVDIYSQTFGIRDTATQTKIRNTPWLRVDNPRSIPNRPYVINRSARWQNPASLEVWQAWRADGAEESSIFVGLENEWQDFQQFTGWQLPYYPAKSLLELAELIAGAGQYIGNQSLGLALAIGLGRPYTAELRGDLPRERNECWFPDHPNGDYF